MEIKINIKKRHLYIFSAIIGVLIGILIVNAYNPSGTGGSPAIFGHSVDEIDWNNPIVTPVFQINGDRITVRKVGAGGTSDTQGINFIADEANNRLHIDVGGSGHSNDAILLGDPVLPSNDVIINGKLRLSENNFYTRTQSCTVPNGQNSCSVNVLCDSGDIVTGGGTIGGLLSSSIPNPAGDGWSCTATSGAASSITCYARCFDVN